MIDYQVGDRVIFYPILEDRLNYYERTVTGVYPEGFLSCREPMLMLKGYAGVVLASHCKPSPLPEATAQVQEKKS